MTTWRAQWIFVPAALTQASETWVKKSSDALTVIQCVCVCVCVCVCLFMYMYVCSVAQFCLTLRDPMHCSPPGSSVYGILQARTLEWVAMPSSKGSSRPRNWTQVSCFAGRFCSDWATRETPSLSLPNQKTEVCCINIRNNWKVIKKLKSWPQRLRHMIAYGLLGHVSFGNWDFLKKLH